MPMLEGRMDGRWTMGDGHVLAMHQQQNPYRPNFNDISTSFSQHFIRF